MVALSVPIQMHLQIFPSQQLRGRHFTQHPLQISTIFRKNVYTDRNLKTRAVSDVQDASLVIGRVTAVQRDGASVTVNGQLEGFLPGQEGPWTLETGVKREAMQELVPVGLKREFLILDANSEEAARIRGRNKGKPILSARAVDRDVLWKRMEQMQEVCAESCENFKVKVSGANTGGLTFTMGGLPAFVPVSQLAKKADRTWWTQDEMAESFIGQEISVAILEVSQEGNKIVCSVIRAIENDKIRRLEIGALVQGVVRRVEHFGVFVGISGTRVSGLLHVSNISRSHIDRPEEVFTVGEKIQCLILGIEYDYSNISLSTAELETSDYTVLNNKAKVWEEAEKQAAIFQEQLEAEGASYYD